MVVNTYKDRGIGKFNVICGGKATLPNGWCNSVWTWLLILGPSTLQIIYINPEFASGWNILI